VNLQQEIDCSIPATGAGSVIADLQAIAKRSGDPALSSATRRISWQLAHAEDRRASADAAAQSLSERFEIIVKQRDEAVTAARVAGTAPNAALQARIERQGAEVTRAIKQAKDAIEERDEMRWVWESLRIETADLKTRLAEITKQKADIAAQNVSLNKHVAELRKTKPSKPPPPPHPAVFDTIPPVEPGPDEVVLVAQRTMVLAEVERLSTLGKHRTPAAHARLVALQAQLAEFAPKLKALKAARHAELMARQAAALAKEAASLIR
jgi:hypothetical protein